MSDSTDRRLLFVDYASGAISAKQLQALEAALREDPVLRREFIEYMNIDSALGDMAALSETELAEFETATIGSGSTATAIGIPEAIAMTDDQTSQAYRVVALLGAAAAALLFAAFMWFASPGEDQQAPVATLVTGVDAFLSCDGQPQNDTDLLAGEYRLERGLVHLQFADGVMVYVEAPAHFQAISAARVVLHGGRLSASVPPEGVGFTVETPEAEVVDFGTEFSVDVAGGASEVHVFEGRVRVQPRSPSGAKKGNAVDLRTSQAVMIDNVTEKPVEIELATDRFIRTFDESRRSYARTVKQLSPAAFYRMAIRDQGLTCVPPEYSGVVLTGDGNRPPHASGVFAGGSLRVLADSMGRGGRVDTSPLLQTGQFTLSAFVYLEASAPNGVVANTLRSDGGSFALALDEKGLLQATVRGRGGDLLTVSGDTALALHTWRHVVMTVDGQRLSLYEDGRLVASSPCPLLADSEADVLWFGTDANGQNLWNGRIDEVVLFDKALSIVEVTNLYQAALEEIGKSE
jgi:ferric-dicitrate binding protein FerR (iron transport regulator)